MVRRLVFLFLVLSGGLGVLGLGVPGEAHRVRDAGGGRPTRKMRFANSAVDEFVEVDDVTVPAVEAQTEAPTPSDVCAECCARKRRRSLRFGFSDACVDCGC